MSEYILPHVDGYLKLGQDYDCSDIHLAVNSRPTWRRFGQLLPIWEEAPNLTPQDTEVLARGFLEDPEWNRLQQRGDVDFAYANDFGRYRASVVKQRLGYDICFRIINTRVRTMEEIGLPTEYVVPLTRYTNGLILVTGSVGSGKSTTLASIVDFINQDRHDHIITLEDPIEYLIPSKNCHVNQREVHKHTESFARALRGALREDPDVIMVGEMPSPWRSRRQKPATWCSAPCIRVPQPVRWTACWTSSRWNNATRYASWSANPCAASSPSSWFPEQTATAALWPLKCWLIRQLSPTASAKARHS